MQGFQDIFLINKLAKSLLKSYRFKIEVQRFCLESIV